jgi:hypothetical protein
MNDVIPTNPGDALTASTSPASAGRKWFGGFIGMLVGFLVVAIGEGISHTMYPPPEGVKLGSPELMEFIQGLPSTAFVVLVIAHAAGAFSCGLACAMFVRNGWKKPVVVCGALFALAGIMNLVQIPHPVWFGVLDVLVYLPMVLLGGLTANGILPGCRA